jgi:hypothetical protein
MKRRTFLAAALLAAACSPRAPGVGGTDRELITNEQLVAGHYRNVYEAIESLRPAWLRRRGPDSFRAPSEVVVYLDNVRFGGVEELRGIDVNTIGYIRHYGAAEASNRWGLDHGAGAISLSTRTTRAP